MFKKETYKDQVIKYIYKEILKGNLKPKDQIKESHLSEVLSISRAPIREALKELNSLGIVEYKPRVGNFVVDITEQDILDTYTTRGLLEGYAAANSVDKLSKKNIDKLYEYCSMMENFAKENKEISLIDLGDKFHELLFIKCENQLLVKYIRNLSIKSHILFKEYWSRLYTPSEINQRHRLIVDTLVMGDKQKIEKVIREHYQETGEKMVEIKLRNGDI